MTGQDLKNSILQLAIQGKLVPQDANDEPASVLLSRIRKEKERLIKEKKIKKEKPLAPITEDEKPFEIPESWEWVRWGDLSFSIQYGFNASAQMNGDIRMVRISDIQNNEVLWETVPYCSIKKEDIETYLLASNDILFARTGGTVGKSFLVKTVPYPAIYAGYLIRTRYSKELIPQYMKFFMESKLYWEQLKEGTIATAQPNCNGKTLSNMILPLPPLSEQHRIVEKIEELMPLVEEYDKAQKELDDINHSLPERLKQSILQEAIMGKLGTNNPEDEPASELLKRIRKEKEQLIKDKKIKKEKPLPEITDEEKPFEIPENWEWVRLGEISTIINGFTPLRTNPEFWENGTVNWFTVEDIHSQGRRIKDTKQKINTKALSKDTKRIIPGGSLLLCCTASVGEYAFNEVPLTTNQQFNGIVINDNYKRLVNGEYLFSIAPMFKSWLLDLAGKTTFNFVSVKKVEGIPIPLPPLAEQHRIVEKLDSLLPMISELNKQ